MNANWSLVDQADNSPQKPFANSPSTHPSDLAQFLLRPFRFSPFQSARPPSQFARPPSQSARHPDSRPPPPHTSFSSTSDSFPPFKLWPALRQCVCRYKSPLSSPQIAVYLGPPLSVHFYLMREVLCYLGLPYIQVVPTFHSKVPVVWTSDADVQEEERCTREVLKGIMKG